MPSTPEENAYDVLKIPRTATQDEIKKRYREMARQYHPDVNPNNPTAAKTFASVSQAYKALSDPDSRKIYDAEMILREQRAQQSQARTNYGSAASARPGGTPPPRAASPQNTAATNSSESSRLTAEARSAFLRDRPVEARTLSEQAIRLNRRNAEAWEILGDVFRRQGRSEDAINAYSMSLQINPRNASVMQRLERMARAAGPSATTHAPSRGSQPQSGSAPPPSAPSSGYGSSSAYRASGAGRVSRMQDPEKRPLGLLLVGFTGYGAVLMAILYAAFFPGDPPPPHSVTPLLEWVSLWNATIVTILGLCGLVLGATMTITGTIRRIDDELILSGVSGRSGTFMPLGLLLIVISVVNFYFAAIVYAIITAFQESFTPSMMRVFGATTAVVLLLSAAYTPDHLQVLLFGGNVVFVAFVIGWLLGDFFRSDIA